MHVWAQWLMALAVLIVAGLATVWAARNARKIRGTLGLGAILLGFGQAIDPPKRHMLEAADPTKPSPGNDEPVI